MREIQRPNGGDELNLAQEDPTRVAGGRENEALETRNELAVCSPGELVTPRQNF